MRNMKGGLTLIGSRSMKLCRECGKIAKQKETNGSEDKLEGTDASARHIEVAPSARRRLHMCMQRREDNKLLKGDLRSGERVPL